VEKKDTLQGIALLLPQLHLQIKVVETVINVVKQVILLGSVRTKRTVEEEDLRTRWLQ